MMFHSFANCIPQGTAVSATIDMAVCARLLAILKTVQNLVCCTYRIAGNLLRVNLSIAMYIHRQLQTVYGCSMYS